MGMVNNQYLDQQNSSDASIVNGKYLAIAYYQ
jgi:hypothetical protein